MCWILGLLAYLEVELCPHLFLGLSIVNFLFLQRVQLCFPNLCLKYGNVYAEVIDYFSKKESNYSTVNSPFFPRKCIL